MGIRNKLHCKISAIVLLPFGVLCCSNPKSEVDLKQANTAVLMDEIKLRNQEISQLKSEIDSLRKLTNLMVLRDDISIHELLQKVDSISNNMIRESLSSYILTDMTLASSGEVLVLDYSDGHNYNRFIFKIESQKNGKVKLKEINNGQTNQQ